jgi:hypothetical protein
MTKKKLNRESGIYRFRVDGVAVRRKIPALTKLAAIERYKQEFREDATKHVTAEKFKDMPVREDAEQYARKLEEIEQQAEEAIKAQVPPRPS